MNAGSYSLWLMPEGELFHSLRGLIRELSIRHLTPFFLPHVTLLGRLEGDENRMHSKVSALASDLSPLALQLGVVEGLDEFFRSLFIQISNSPSLSEAHRKALDIFGVRDEPPFVPHLSLLYSNVSFSTKRDIVREIGSDFQQEFTARQLHLFSTRGDPSLWHQLASYPFGVSTA